MPRDRSRRRLRRLLPSNLTAAQTELYRAIAGGSRAVGLQHFALTDADGALRGPFAAFLLSPEVGDAMQRLGSAIRFESSLDDRVRELAILAVADAESSAFEWESHAAVAKSLGLREVDLLAVRAGWVPPSLEGRDIDAYCFARAAIAGDIDDDLWDELAPSLTEAEVLELLALVGYYRTLAMILRVGRLE